MHARTPDFYSHQISASQNDLHAGKGFLSVRSCYQMEVLSLSPLHTHDHKCRSCAFLSVLPVLAPKLSACQLPGLRNARGECPKPACNWCPKGGPLGTKRTFLRELPHIFNGSVLPHKAQCWKAPLTMLEPHTLRLMLSPTSLQRH